MFQARLLRGNSKEANKSDIIDDDVDSKRFEQWPER